MAATAPSQLLKHQNLRVQPRNPANKPQPPNRRFLLSSQIKGTYTRVRMFPPKEPDTGGKTGLNRARAGYLLYTCEVCRALCRLARDDGSLNSRLEQNLLQPDPYRIAPWFSPCYLPFFFRLLSSSSLSFQSLGSGPPVRILLMA